MDSGEVRWTVDTERGDTRRNCVIHCLKSSRLSEIAMTALHQICLGAETMLHFRWPVAVVSR